MYKYLLCWRYLRTRYIALASIVSVMLGVATMIVVNSVMAGFAEKMRSRLHGVLADVVVESYDLDGFMNSPEIMARIQAVAGDKIQAMAPTMETFGLMKIRVPSGQTVTRQVQVIGVRPEERARTGDFAEFLVDDNDKRIPPSFEVSDKLRQNSPAGQVLNTLDPDNPEDRAFADALKQQSLEQVPDHGTIIGYALATIHRQGVKADYFMARPGAKVYLALPSG
ncbi:MAG TPA: ABC transporter permease, partial [Isosphaeraceae bacterium]|nr:ABC transporter permease [Isosphaeraceae bacterium]